MHIVTNYTVHFLLSTNPNPMKSGIDSLHPNEFPFIHLEITQFLNHQFTHPNRKICFINSYMNLHLGTTKNIEKIRIMELTDTPNFLQNSSKKLPSPSFFRVSYRSSRLAELEPLLPYLGADHLFEGTERKRVEAK